MEDMGVKHIPLISVIMLTYNRELLVGRMIDCILAQSFQEFEYIIVDNGSTDKTAEIVDSYATMDSRIKVIHCSRGNIGSGRNIGLDAACGDYIAFVDDDDTCETDFLAFLYELIQANDADIAICGATWCNRCEICVMDAEHAIETLLWRKKYNVAFPTKLLKRNLFEHHRFLETGSYDDIYLMPLIMADAKRIAYHGLSKYHFTRHEGNHSAWTQNHQLLNFETLMEYLNVYQQRTDYLCNKFFDQAAKWRYFNWSFMISMIDKVTKYSIKDCDTVREHLVWELRKNFDEFYHCPWIQEQEKEWMNHYIVHRKEET